MTKTKDAKDIKIPDIGKRYGAGLKSLFIIYWVMAAFLGTGVAVGLGLARNDWLVASSDASASTMRIGWYVAACAAAGGSVVMGLYGLLAIVRKRQWLLFLPCLALGASFPVMLAAPQWVAFAFGGSALALGVIVLWVVDRKAARRADA